MYLDDLKFTKTHEWVHLNKNNIGRIGITDHAQQRLGKILFVELPEMDRELEQFDAFFVVESESVLSEIYAPISGRVVTINEELDDDPTIINHDPYGDGWIVEVELSHESEIDDLMSYAEYGQFLEAGGNEE